MELLVILFLVLATNTIAQDSLGVRTGDDSIYLELGGTALVYSMNYEKLFNDHFALRFGISFFEVFSSVTIFPMSVSWLLSDSNSDWHIELGGSAGLVVKEQFYFGPIIGIRKHNVSEGGFLFRVTATPFWDPLERERFFWAGISIGGSF